MPTPNQGRKARKLPRQRGSQDQAPQSKPWTLKEFSGKPVWAWLQLLSVLAIPVALAAAGFYFETQLDQRQRASDKSSAQVEHAIEEQRAQDEALQAYLDQMTKLLLEEDLRKKGPDSEPGNLARARTLTVLDRFDSSRKREVIQFLAEADLIDSEKNGPIFGLDYADLSGANLGRASKGFGLRGVWLTGANLSNANLFNADLEGADLGDAILSDANLRKAWLPGAYLSDANLSGANLSDVNLRKADLSRTNLQGANLSGANLQDTWMIDTNLKHADLSNADLRKAHTDVSTQLISNEMLNQQASSLKGATMPNGQKYEEWLKEKEGRGEDGENPGPS